MECGAADKRGNALYCYLFSPSASLATALAGINETSYIQFYSSTSTSQCTYNERGISLTNDQAQLRLVVRDELHAALKEELAVALVGKNFNATATVVVPASPATPQQLAQRQEALGEVDAVIAGGKWSNDDRRRFHQSVAMLDPQQAQEAFQRLGESIKNGGMKLGLDQ